MIGKKNAKFITLEKTYISVFLFLATIFQFFVFPGIEIHRPDIEIAVRRVFVQV